MGGEGALAAWRHRGVTRRALGSPPAAEAQCKPYYSDYSRFRFLIHQMCTSHYLDLFITGVIGLNVITMAMEHYQQPKVSVLWLVDAIQGASALWSGGPARHARPWAGGVHPVPAFRPYPSVRMGPVAPLPSG